jgi:hypothetical protein
MVLKKKRLKPHTTFSVGDEEGISGAGRWRDPPLLLSILGVVGGVCLPFSLFLVVS